MSAAAVLLTLLQASDPPSTATPELWDSVWIKGSGWVVTLLGVIIALITLYLVGTRRSAFQRALNVLTRQHSTRGARDSALALHSLAGELTRTDNPKRACSIATRWSEAVGDFEANLLKASADFPLASRSYAWESAEGRQFSRAAASSSYTTSPDSDVVASRGLVEDSQLDLLRVCLDESVQQATCLVKEPTRDARNQFAASVMQAQRAVRAAVVHLETVGAGDLHDDR
jgi:hypothetical protein